MEIERDYFKIGERYGRVLFLKEYASYIKDRVSDSRIWGAAILVSKLVTS